MGMNKGCTLKTGVVTKVNQQECTVVVKFDVDDIESKPLLVTMPSVRNSNEDDGRVGFHIMPKLKENVVCIMDEHCEEGFVVGAFYNDKWKPNSEAPQVFPNSFFFQTEGHRIEIGGGTINIVTNNSDSYILMSSNGITIKGGASATRIIDFGEDGLIIRATSGNIQMKGQGGSAAILGLNASSNKIVAKNGSQDLKLILEEILDLIVAHGHPAHGSPPANAAMFTAVKTKIAALMTS